MDMGRDPREGNFLSLGLINCWLVFGCGSILTNHVYYPQPVGSVALQGAAPFPVYLQVLISTEVASWMCKTSQSFYSLNRLLLCRNG